MRVVFQRHGGMTLSWLFLMCGTLAALATRNAMAVAMLSAVALPVAIVVALIAGEAALSMGVWLCWPSWPAGCRHRGPGRPLALWAAWARNLTGGLFRGSPNGKHGT